MGDISPCLTYLHPHTPKPRSSSSGISHRGAFGEPSLSNSNTAMLFTSLVRSLSPQRNSSYRIIGATMTTNANHSNPGDAPQLRLYELGVDFIHEYLTETKAETEVASNRIEFPKDCLVGSI